MSPCQGSVTLTSLMIPPLAQKKERSARTRTSLFFSILVLLPGQPLVDGDLGDGLGDGIGDLGIEG